MKRTFTLILACLTYVSYGQIISQYVETNSGTFPKGIEIWNSTTSTFDFATNNLVIEKGTNGANPAPDITISTGTLAPGDVMVIGTADMGTYLTTNSISCLYVEKSFTFNGDDALVVKYGGVTTDVLGTPGTDPGSAWTGNGVSTANQNIELLPSIFGGDVVGNSDPSLRFGIVSTDPVGATGLAGFGIPPSYIVPASIRDVQLSAEVQGADVSLRWNSDSDHGDIISIDRLSENRKVVTIVKDAAAETGQIVDRNVPNGKYVYSVYSKIEGGYKVYTYELVDITENSNIQITPNPAKDYVEIYPIRDMDEIRVYGVAGRELIHIVSPKKRQRIDLSSLAPGMYYISIGSEMIPVTKE